MTRRKEPNPDAITLTAAADLLDLPTWTVTWLRSEGLLGPRLEGNPSYSRSAVEAFLANPFINGSSAAKVLGVTRTRVYQLAEADRIPYFKSPSGRHWYRVKQLEVVANARRVRFGKS
jgi:excisionase family DNA binding protein